MIKVTLFSEKGTKTLPIDESMLTQLIKGINEKGSEWVRTTTDDYKVTGIMIGKTNGKTLIL